MQAIILAGGKGTRLKEISKDIPKPLIDINGRPFLEYLFADIKNYADTVILAVGYRRELIKERFGDIWHGIKLKYSEETEPLGTGGAIKKALTLCSGEQVLILNGDTIFKCDINGLKQFHNDKKADMTIAVKEITDSDRYGIVELDGNNKIICFKEKAFYKKAHINGGVYLAGTGFLKRKMSGSPGKFSFEIDFLPGIIADNNIIGFASRNYFIDIGVPEDYHKAIKQIFP
ncbi:MAG: nucleotidyltransferase family protein [Candidatus Brocadiia bacterium]